jgi:phosphoribosyl 1,2-cyclic phosphodiesterase
MVEDFQVRFWGVRGSIPCPEPSHSTYGGNTSCVEVRCGETVIVLDAGTGLRPLGKSLLRENVKTIHLLLSHLHLDHIIGLPFFEPAYDPWTRLFLRAGNLMPERRLRETLDRLMSPPFFPISADVFQADVSCVDFRAGETFSLPGDVTVKTAPLRHPDGSTGYRISWRGKSLCYITDTEHPPTGLDPNILELIQNTDLMIYDATYCNETYPKHSGWGHSTWEAGVALAKAAAVRQFALFHHDPNRTDEALAAIAAKARASFAGAFAAQEGQTVVL